MTFGMVIFIRRCVGCKLCNRAQIRWETLSEDIDYWVVDTFTVGTIKLRLYELVSISALTWFIRCIYY